MRKLNQNGAINALFIPMVLVTILFIGATLFGLWAFVGREDYKSNVDEKIAAAVEVAKQETASSKDNEFAERDKQPLKSYSGPATFGSLKLDYPKTWSAYINESGRGSSPIDGYFHPNFVPGIDPSNAFALRVEVVESTYAQELKKYDGQARSGTVKVSPFAAAKVPTTVGARIDGEIISKKKGSIILLPLRDKTIKIWTEAEQYQEDFNEFILPSLSFTP